MRVFMLLGIVALAQCKTVDIKWKDCSDSSYHGKVKDIKITPNPPVLGKPISVEATGSLDEGVSGGQYELKIKKLITILDHKDNVCGNSTIKLPLGMGSITVVGLTCPTKAGTVTLGQDMTISESAPSGTIDIDLTAKDAKGGNLVCVSVTATVSSDEKQVSPLQDLHPCKSDKDCPDLKCGSYCMNDASKKPPYFCHARDPKMGCCSNLDCPGSYCMNSPDKTPPFSCHGGKKNAAMIEAPVDKYCLHKEDQLDHKCYEDCAASKFANKGVTTDGKCPSAYSVVEKTKVVAQCLDGVTNLRYCPGTAVNVTMVTKGVGA